MEPVPMRPDASAARPRPTALHSHEAIMAHLDKLVAPPARDVFGAYGILCDLWGTPVTNATVDECPFDPSVRECAQVVGEFAKSLLHEDPRGKLLLAVTRPGPGQVVETDRRWYQGLNRACALHDVRPLGVYVLTSAKAFPVTLDDVL